jgi:hypothetical protein
MIEILFRFKLATYGEIPIRAKYIFYLPTDKAVESSNRRITTFSNFGKETALKQKRI